MIHQNYPLSKKLCCFMCSMAGADTSVPELGSTSHCPCPGGVCTFPKSSHSSGTSWDAACSWGQR